MEEIFEICETATVMRDGRIIGTVNVGEVSSDRIVEMMVGREVSSAYPRRDTVPGEEILRVEKDVYKRQLYRPAALQRDLDSDAAAKLLAGAGYPCGSCGGCVAALVRRMRSSAEFPHEVGLFLSYPPEDVKGFIENRAANAKCTGVWKVYGLSLIHILVEISGIEPLTS